MEYFVKFTKFEKENLFEIKLFYFPVLTHAGREARPGRLRDLQRGRVILFVIRTATVKVTDLSLLKKWWQSSVNLVNRVEASPEILILLILLVLHILLVFHFLCNWS